MAVKKTETKKKNAVAGKRPSPETGHKAQTTAAGKTPSRQIGHKAKEASAGKRPSRKTGGDDFSSISIHEKVALLAYSYWEERGKQGGSPEEDWFRAEREVLTLVSRKNT